MFRPAVLSSSPFTVATRIRRQPLFVGGRYLKLARGISQTPWFIGGQLKTEISVSGCISGLVQKAMKADECGFVSAGREDADVRMLGTGRPYFLEIRNARVSHLNTETVMKEINELWQGQVQINGLQVVNKYEIASFKRDL
jgi:tRNA pseudouridine synthase 10